MVTHFILTVVLPSVISGVVVAVMMGRRFERLRREEESRVPQAAPREPDPEPESDSEPPAAPEPAEPPPPPTRPEAGPWVERPSTFKFGLGPIPDNGKAWTRQWGGGDKLDPNLIQAAYIEPTSFGFVWAADRSPHGGDYDAEGEAKTLEQAKRACDIVITGNLGPLFVSDDPKKTFWDMINEEPAGVEGES